MNLELLYYLVCDHWHPEMLLGPILLFSRGDTGDFAAGVGLCVILIPAMAVGFLHPRSWSLAISMVAIMTWGIIGKLLEGASC